MRSHCDCDAWGYMCDQGRRCPRRAQPEDANCHGPCRQGTLPCPTPEACERPDDELPYSLADLIVAVACIGAVLAMVSLYILEPLK